MPGPDAHDSSKSYIVRIGGGLPCFGGGSGQLAYAKLHHDHYSRLEAVLAAARTGDALLIRLAVEHQDRFGYEPTEIAEPER